MRRANRIPVDFFGVMGGGQWVTSGTPHDAQDGDQEHRQTKKHDIDLPKGIIFYILLYQTCGRAKQGFPWKL